MDTLSNPFDPRIARDVHFAVYPMQAGSDFAEIQVREYYNLGIARVRVGAVDLRVHRTEADQTLLTELLAAVQAALEWVIEPEEEA